MVISDPEQFIDLVAQAVIDKLEERSRIQSLVEKIVVRVRELQQEEHDLTAAAQREQQNDAVKENM